METKNNKPKTTVFPSGFSPERISGKRLTAYQIKGCTTSYAVTENFFGNNLTFIFEINLQIA